MSRPTRYRELEVGGPPFELGRQIGEAAREEIRAFAAIALERVNKTTAISPRKAMETAAASIPYIEGYSPEMLEELRGMAAASGLPLEELVLLQIRNQLRPDAEAGCTSFATRSALVGQNWDNDPALDPFTLVLTRRPRGKPAFINITQAGLIAYIGCNDQGVGLCLNTLPAPSRPLGVPHYCTVRGIYEAAGLDGALEAVRRARRAIPANIILATPQGPADFEVTIDEVHVLTDEEGGLLTHTNHCLHPALVSINEDFAELINSRPRKARIDQLLGGGPHALEEMQAALSDHQNHPCSICRHPNDHPQHGFWTSVFSVIVEAAAGRLHISRGNPCTHPYETYTLN